MLTCSQTQICCCCKLCRPVVEEAWAVSSAKAVSDDGCPHCNASAPSSSSNAAATNDDGEWSDGLGDDNWLYMSAVCFIYGRKIQQVTGKPVGLVNTNWGGTPVEFWMSSDAHQSCGTYLRVLHPPPYLVDLLLGDRQRTPSAYEYSSQLEVVSAPSALFSARCKSFHRQIISS